MGGELGTTTKKRLAGEICCNWKNLLPPPHTHGERYCDKCKPPTKHVYVAFEQKRTWQVVFCDSATQQRLKIVTLHDADKIIELASRAGALTYLESKQSIENAISNARVECS